MASIDNEHLAAELRTVITRLVKKLRKKSEVGSQLSLTQRSTLAMLYQSEMLPSELAAHEKITNQSMSQVLNHLDDLGLINRKPSETDKRKVVVSISEKGVSLLLQMREERNHWLARAIAETCFPPEQEAMLKAIGPLTKILDFE